MSVRAASATSSAKPAAPGAGVTRPPAGARSAWRRRGGPGARRREGASGSSRSSASTIRPAATTSSSDTTLGAGAHHPDLPPPARARRATAEALRRLPSRVTPRPRTPPPPPSRWWCTAPPAPQHGPGELQRRVAAVEAGRGRASARRAAARPGGRAPGASGRPPPEARQAELGQHGRGGRHAERVHHHRHRVGVQVARGAVEPGQGERASACRERGGEAARWGRGPGRRGRREGGHRPSGWLPGRCGTQAPGARRPPRRDD